MVLGPLGMRLTGPHVMNYGGFLRVWEDCIRKLYPNIMSEAKKESIKMARLEGFQFDGSDFSVLKPYNPEWIKSTYWEDMIDRVWNMRLPKHCSGSLSIVLLKRRLEEKLHITPADVFELTRTNKVYGSSST